LYHYELVAALIFGGSDAIRRFLARHHGELGSSLAADREPLASIAADCSTIAEILQLEFGELGSIDVDIDLTRAVSNGPLLRQDFQLRTLVGACGMSAGSIACKSAALVA
jgi:hypothetical protein